MLNDNSADNHEVVKMYDLEEVRKIIIQLSLPDEPFIRRRVARAMGMSKSSIDVEHQRVHSQASPEIWYNINLDSGSPSCSCPDGNRTIFCKHRIALMLAVVNENEKGELSA